MKPSIEILQSGYFDSQVKYPNISVSQDRRVNSYEIEFYADSFPRNSFINGQAFPFRAGQILVAKPGDIRHSELPFCCYYMHLRTEDADICSFLQAFPPVFLTVFPEEILSLFQEYLKAEDMSEPMRSFAVRAVTYRILYLLSLEKPESDMATVPFKNRQVLLSARNFMDKHFADAISLSDIAEHVHLSPNYFHKIFTDYYRTTPGKYLENKRIADAKFRLVTTDDSISQIATLSGFSSQSYFTTKFTAATGSSPLAYRREMRSHGTV